MAQTAPPDQGEPLERLLASMTAYLDYVTANHQGYVSLVRGAAGGNAAMRQVYDDARTALTDRIFTTHGTPHREITDRVVAAARAISEQLAELP